MRDWPRRCNLVLLAAAMFTGVAGGTPITVKLSTRSGATAQDSVVVLDPLDAPAAAAGAGAGAGGDRASIDQVHKRFVPRINVLRTGTLVTFPNSDNIRHQVYSFSPAKTFTLKLYAGVPASPVTFDKPGLVVLGCNIHDEMVAFVVVVDSPYFAKAGSDGTASLDVPPGRYRLRIWHPSLTTVLAPQQLDVAAAPLALALMLDLNPASSDLASWPE